jgi:hypothetical protein
MTPRVAIYARVSTANHGQDVTLQTRELQQFAEARGWHTVGTYIDDGSERCERFPTGFEPAHGRRAQTVLRRSSRLAF